MKTLIIGCGGIGSFVIDEIGRKIEQGQIEFDEQIAIADGDMVEMKQLKYQNFKENDIGKNKAESLAKRCKALGVDIFKALPKRISKESELKGYDFYILCVDNEKTREMVINYAYKHNKQFIDLRANGRKIFVMPKGNTLLDNMKFIDTNDKIEYSCQDKEDLEKDWIQLGNKIVALMGVQAIMNYQRGYPNKIIMMVI